MGFATDSKRGVLVHYGPRDTDESFGGELATKGKQHQIVYKFSYSDLPGGSTDALTAFVPSGAMITEAYFIPTTAFAGGTSYDIGLIQSNNSTEIDLDGLFDALVLADIDASIGTALTASLHGGTNSGALVGSVLTADGYLKVAATGTFTAGEATFILEYVL